LAFVLLDLDRWTPRTSRGSARSTRLSGRIMEVNGSKGRSKDLLMLSRSQVSRVRALHRRKGREESGEFLVEGIRQAEDLIASSVVPRLALVSPSLEDSERGRVLATRVRAATATVEVTDAELAQLATTETTQGIVVVAETPRAVLGSVPLHERSLIIVLDAVQDPGNFGTIARSADAFGASMIVTLPGTVDPWNPKAVRSAAGASLRIPVVESTLTELLAHLHERGATLYGAEVGGESVEQATPDGIARQVRLDLSKSYCGLSLRCVVAHPGRAFRRRRHCQTRRRCPWSQS
jgi:TrmH family RNA methyltransferase